MIKTKRKIYTSAPMPFMGQKRRFVSDFKEALKLFDNSKIFVDLFGGSGLLSYVTKQERPDARVIYNDFDDYHLRLKNCKRTNELLADIRGTIVDVPKEKKLPDEIKKRVLKRIYKDAQTGFIDYITLSSSLLISSNYVTDYKALEKATLYNNLKQSDYNCDGYLDGLEVVKEDYKMLFNKYKDRKDVVFFVDPPYLSTEVGVYKSYWKLSDYLDVLSVINDVSYFYFTSEKSSIIELLDWFDINLQLKNPLAGACRKETLNRLNINAQYKDIMLYKKVL